MREKQSDDNPNRDDLLLRLLKTPHQPRPKRERGKEKSSIQNRRDSAPRANEGKHVPSA